MFSKPGTTFAIRNIRPQTMFKWQTQRLVSKLVLLTILPKRAEITAIYFDVQKFSIFTRLSQQTPCYKLLRWLIPGKGADCQSGQSGLCDYGLAMSSVGLCSKHFSTTSGQNPPVISRMRCDCPECVFFPI